MYIVNEARLSVRQTQPTSADNESSKKTTHSQQTSADKNTAGQRQNNSADLSRCRQTLMQRGYVRKTQQTSADNLAGRLHATKINRQKHICTQNPYVRITRPERANTYARRLRAKKSSDISRHFCTSAGCRKHPKKSRHNCKIALCQEYTLHRKTLKTEFLVKLSIEPICQFMDCTITIQW